jgi:uncharacterized repeat protein (TIGR01451 family)
MKRAKMLLTSASFVLGSFFMPLVGGRVAAASCDAVGEQCSLPSLDTNPLVCDNPSVEVFEPTAEGCDLSVDKQVSVNSGPFVEADTSAAAAQAHVGDTITWQITVSNTSDSGLVPRGSVTVNDVLPTAGVTFDSYTASAGTYSGSAWTFDLKGNLPASLTITSHSAATGLFQNTASLSFYDSCSDDCLGTYVDSNSANNSNDAWIDPSAPPAVLGLSSGDPQVLALTNTGSSTVPSLIAGTLIVGTIGIAGYGRLYRRSNINSL